MEVKGGFHVEGGFLSLLSVDKDIFTYNIRPSLQKAEMTQKTATYWPIIRKIGVYRNPIVTGDSP